MKYWTGVQASSNTDDWMTPPHVFRALDREFGFTLDVCASDTNAWCDRYFTVDDDGLAQDWGTETCWMNPPYGRTIGQWMWKAYEASQQGATVVCLVPARTDTAWFHDIAVKGTVRFVRGRLKFGGAVDPAPFPSAVVVYYPA